MYIYIYWWQQCWFVGVCLNSLHPIPRYEWSGGGCCSPCAISAGSGGCCGMSRQVPGGGCLCLSAGIALESHLLWNWTPSFSKAYYMSLGQRRGPPWQPKAPQSGPRAAQRGSNGPQSQPKDRKRKLKDMQKRLISHKIVCIYIYAREQNLRKFSMCRHTAADW